MYTQQESKYINTCSNSPQQIMTIDEKCEKDNVVDLQNTSPNTKIITCTMSADKLKNSINSQQENSLNMKTDSSAVSEIIDKNNTKYKLMCKNSDY